jgi:hypothetical protein
MKRLIRKEYYTPNIGDKVTSVFKCKNCTVHLPISGTVSGLVDCVEENCKTTWNEKIVICNKKKIKICGFYYCTFSKTCYQSDSIHQISWRRVE